MARAPSTKKTPPPGSNSGQTAEQISDDQTQALTRQHAQKRAKLVEVEKTAKAARMNFDKIIKSDLGASGLDDIKLLEKLSTPEGEKELKDEMDRQIRVARWAGLQIGTQGSLFGLDERPIKERAFDEGKRDGMASEGPLKPPANYSPGSDGSVGYIEGWHEGQKALFAIKKGPTQETAGLIVADGNKQAGPDDFDTGGEGGDGTEPPVTEASTTGDGSSTAGETGGEQTMWPDDEAAAAKKKAAAGAPSTETVN